MILKGRIAIVTGAGSGIGRGGAQILAREGAQVIVSDLSGERSEETVRLIRQEGGKAIAKKLDVTDNDALKKLIVDTYAEHERIDILHSHAGMQVEGTLEEVTIDGLDNSYALNVRPHFVAAQACVPLMRNKGGGSIINTASNSGVFIDRGMLAYTTTKAAIIMMTKQIALDYAKYNIRCNALCPGWVDTPFNDPYIRQMGGRTAIEKYVSETIPMGRWASIDEIAESILFLASDRSSFMTGHALVMDGGECIA